MASIYSCKECGANISLNAVDLFPPDYYFDAGNKNTLSFARVDPSKLRPFFESLNYWGIQRNRTTIKCNTCGRVVGHVYDDGAPLMDHPQGFQVPIQDQVPLNFSRDLTKLIGLAS